MKKKKFQEVTVDNSTINAVDSEYDILAKNYLYDKQEEVNRLNSVITVVTNLLYLNEEELRSVRTLVDTLIKERKK